MKLSVTLVSALLGISVAASPRQLSRRQVTQNDVKSGSCKKVFLIFARASTEVGNMGETMGPAVCSGLKGKLGAGSVGCQGVGGPYTAGLVENVSAKGTTDAAIGEAQKMFKMAAEKCPQATIVAGGYSQGTAVIMNAVSTLPDNVKSKIAGVVLFGYTKNGQTKGTIPNFPTEKLKVFCTKSDGVCWGNLVVSPGHFAYVMNGDGTSATQFLVSKINGFVPGAPAAAAPAKGEGEKPAAEEAPAAAAPEAAAPEAAAPEAAAPEAAAPEAAAPAPKMPKGMKGMGGKGNFVAYES